MSGEIPCRKAVASTIGLNDEPGWRSACVARLNWLRRKLEPPNIARTAPFARVDRHERGCGAVLVGQHLLDRRARELLQAEVDRRIDAEPAAEDAVRLVAADELVADVVDEVRRRPSGAGQADVLGLRQRLRVRLRHVGGGDLPLLGERREHEVPALERLARVPHGVVAGRVGGQAGEQRGFVPAADVSRPCGSRRAPLAGSRRRRCRSRSCSGTRRGCGSSTTAAPAARRGRPPAPCARSSSRSGCRPA